MLPFLVSRYFGQREYSKLFGLSMSFFGLGYAIAPPAAGFLFDRIGSYTVFLTVLAGLLVLAGLVAATFGRYPDATPESPAETQTQGRPASGPGSLQDDRGRRANG